MKAIMIKGFSKTGKTTTCTEIIRELVKRGYSVGSIKDIHFEGFSLDTENEDTWKHARAGASVVTARGLKETDVIYHRQLDVEEILPHYDQDYLVCEGDCGLGCANIVTGKTKEQLDQRRDENTVGFSGVISSEISEYDGLPVINGTKEIEKLVDLIEEKSTEIK